MMPSGYHLSASRFGFLMHWLHSQAALSMWWQDYSVNPSYLWSEGKLGSFSVIPSKVPRKACHWPSHISYSLSLSKHCSHSWVMCSLGATSWTESISQVEKSCYHKKTDWVVNRLKQWAPTQSTPYLSTPNTNTHSCAISDTFLTQCSNPHKTTFPSFQRKHPESCPIVASAAS